MQQNGTEDQIQKFFFYGAFRHQLPSPVNPATSEIVVRIGMFKGTGMLLIWPLRPHQLMVSLFYGG